MLKINISSIREKALFCIVHKLLGGFMQRKKERNFFLTLFLNFTSCVVAWSVFFVITMCQGAIAGETYYMPDDFANLQAAFAGMSSGDTLIIRNGTYSGSNNIITQSNYPPAGSYGNYTKIHAENPGSVYFGDPDDSTAYLNMTNGPGGSSDVDAYWEFDGIIWNSVTLTYGINYAKFIECGSLTNTAPTAPSFTISHSSYVLFEDCYADGGGRYKFLAYQSDHIIFRRCVGRLGEIRSGDPIGGVGFYYTSYSEAQNCIIIDSATSDYWTYESLVGAFTQPNGSGNNNSFRGCIALNTDLPTNSTASGYSDTTYENIISWGNITGSLLRGTDTVYRHSTIGSMDTALGNYAAIQNYEGNTTITNSILTGISVNSAVGSVTSDHNSFYNNRSNGTILGSNEMIMTNPLTNSLLYLLRIEDGSDLDGAASDSGDVGATVMKKIGVSGTLWGESGYNTTTDNDLWPWPNEVIIKANMSTYSNENVSGTRGFCSTGKQLNGRDDITLTSYIWEYLGNQMPSDIYGSTSTSTTRYYYDGDDDGWADVDNYRDVESDPGALWKASGELLGMTDDCNDSDASINPGATEICTGQVDEDCDGYIDCDDSDCSADSACTSSSVSGETVDSDTEDSVVYSTLQDFEDGVLWVPGGGQDTTGNGRGWVFTSSAAGDGATIEIDPTVGANGTQKSLKITFNHDDPQIYFRSEEKTTDHMPEANGANRMSFYVRFPADFPIQPLPFRYDTWQFGSYIHDPSDWTEAHAATYEEDYGIHHYYHRLTIEKNGDGWVKYILTTQPDQANYSGSTVPPDITHFFDSFGRFYFHFGPEAGGPEVPNPFTIWIDEIRFYHDDGSVGGQIHVGGQDDEGFDGEYIESILPPAIKDLQTGE